MLILYWNLNWIRSQTNFQRIETCKNFEVLLECCELMFWRKSWREFVVKWNMLNGGWNILLIFAKQCKRNSTESSSLLLTDFLSSFLIDHPDVQNFVKSNQRSFYYGLHPLFDIFSLSFDEQTNIQDPSINSIKIYRTLFFVDEPLWNRTKTMWW